jgi:hypothetical protein
MKLKKLGNLNTESPFRPYRIRPFLSEQLHLFELIKLTQQIAEFQTCITNTQNYTNETCKIRK